MLPDLSTIVALGSLAFTGTNVVRYAAATDWSSIASQVIAWMCGILACQVVALTDLGHNIYVGSTTLQDLSILSKVLLGLVAASAISIVYQFKQSLDRTDSAAVPSLSPKKRVTATLD